MTGASSGIGQAIAIECSRMGAAVVLTARSQERLEETLGRMENIGIHTLIQADLSNEEDIARLAESISGKLDGIVQCAGFLIPKPFQFISESDLNAIMGVNFEAPVRLTQLLFKQKKIAKPASIVFISSISGVFVSAHPTPGNDLSFDEQGNPKSSDYLAMNGSEIFNFTLEAVPVLVADTLQKNNLSQSDVDLFVFHQANKYMMNFLRKKIKIDEKNFYYYLEKVGNTVSSTIPIALKEADKENKLSGNILLAGFGVGYSWGGVIISIQ